MNWGKWIVVSFILFAAFIGVLVSVCVRQDVNLVAKDYYKDELAYQDQIDRLKNTGDLSVKPEISVVENKILQVVFSQFNKIQNGELKFFRPSNEKLDQQFALHTSPNSIQRFELKSLEKGMYRARMQWTMDNKEYYMEKIIII